MERHHYGKVECRVSMTPDKSKGEIRCHGGMGILCWQVTPVCALNLNYAYRIYTGYTVYVFFSRHVFPSLIRTENSVLNLLELNFHDFKSSWKYNHDCLLVWTWDRRNYEQKLYMTFDLLRYLIKSKHHRLSPILLITWLANSLYNGFVWMKVKSINFKLVTFGRRTQTCIHQSCVPTCIHSEFLHTLICTLFLFDGVVTKESRFGEYSEVNTVVNLPQKHMHPCIPWRHNYSVQLCPVIMSPSYIIDNGQRSPMHAV
jgi:hypothetical protein